MNNFPGGISKWIRITKLKLYFNSRFQFITLPHYQVLNAILTPDEETSTVQVACINNGYELIGESSLSCEMCLDNYKTDTIMCKGPTFAEGSVPECRLRPGQ